MRKLNLTGMAFGKLKVIKEVARSRNNKITWLCLCDCGEYTNVSTDHLHRKNKGIKSCGCLRSKQGEYHKDWKGCGDISGHWWANRVMSSVRRRSGRRELELNITVEDAWALFLIQEGNCALTGTPLKIRNDQTNTASLDRIDSSGNYDIENVQWVHKDINLMKRDYTEEYFINMCEKVVCFNGKCEI